MKYVNILADPQVNKSIPESIDFEAPNNDDYTDHEKVIVNFVSKEGKVYTSAVRRVIRTHNAENGQPAWFEAYFKEPSKAV